MTRSRDFTPAQREKMLRQFDRTKSWAEKKALAEKLGVRPSTLYSWRKKIAQHGTLANLSRGEAHAAKANGAPSRKGKAPEGLAAELAAEREKVKLLRDMVQMAIKHGFLATLFE